MNIGFIGIGRMGRFMARNLAKGGHNLTIFDTQKEAAEELLSQVALNKSGFSERNRFYRGRIMGG